MTRLTLPEYGALLAHAVKQRAACTRRQVGAVILDRKGRVVATGYNGVPAGWEHCDTGGCPRGRYTHSEVPAGLGSNHPIPCFAVHAERNAVTWALSHGTDLTECVLYVTEEPCQDCQVLVTEFDLRYEIV